MLKKMENKNKEKEKLKVESAPTVNVQYSKVKFSTTYLASMNRDSKNDCSPLT